MILTMRASRCEGSVIAAYVIMALIALAGAQAGNRARFQYDGQVVADEDQQQQSLGEHVDKLASASGDQFYQKPRVAAEWYRQLMMLGRPDSREAEISQYQLISPNDLTQQRVQQQQQQQRQILDPYNPDYRALISEFKRQSPLANPSRESRAFKPKLMSTARGFGKRAGSQHRLTYADLLAAANQAGGLVASDGKMAAANSMR